MPTLEAFDLIKRRYIRLAGCLIYYPDASARDGWKRLLGGRSVYIERDGDITGLAVVNREVVRVVKANEERWNVSLVPEESVA